MSDIPRRAETLSRRSILVAAFSTVVEWYDFTLYLYMATILSRVFFGGGAASLIDTLAGFAVAYLMRPLGAMLFGHIGDRLGRRRAMLLSMAIMTVAMLATALLPTYAQVGSLAGWLLLGLRCVMAFSVGGEYIGVVAYLMEGAPPRRRGLVTSLASGTSEIGALLAVGVAAITVASMSPATLDGWGWRIPFFVGAALAGSVLLLRSTMQESPAFARQRDSGTLPPRPLRHVLTHHRMAVLRGFAISALGSITYYVGITYVPAFLGTIGVVAEGDALWLSTLAALAVIFVTPLAGAVSDRIGRKPVLIALAILGALLPVAMFQLMAGGDIRWILCGAVALGLLGGAVSAVGAVTTAEQFPVAGRLSGLALGATGATAIFGGFAPYLGHMLVERTGSPLAPGAMIALVALCVLPVLLALPETAGPEQR